VAAESLFNDGVGVVLFLTLLEMGRPGSSVTIGFVSRMLVQEVVGGVALGLMTGFLINYLLQRTHEFQVEVLLTLALVMGTYSLATFLHFSAPIAVVVAGLIIGARGNMVGLTKDVQVDLDHFWGLVDEILNAVLFVLIGLEVLVMHGSSRQWIAAVLCIPATLLARWIAVIGTAGLLPAARRITRPVRIILVWGGLRGGLAVAMALALPEQSHREVVILITYAVVCFSILVQGLTIRPLVQRSFGA
jgi:CPA1 family monovalent cation:H+ antiporter